MKGVKYSTARGISQRSMLIRVTVIIFNPASFSHSIVNVSYANNTSFHNKKQVCDFECQSSRKECFYPINKLEQPRDSNPIFFHPSGNGDKNRIMCFGIAGQQNILF